MDLSNDTFCPYCEISHEKPNMNSKGPFSCNNCNLMLSNKECLERHKKIVHTMAQKIFSCEMCNIDFSARKYLFIHKNHSHKDDESFVHEEIIIERENEMDPFDIKVEILDSKGSGI